MEEKNIIRLLMSSVLILGSALLPTLSQADYKSYTYTGGDNYHIEDIHLSKTGNLIVGRGGSDVSATSDVVLFKAQQTEPIWAYMPGGDEIVFDVNISQDGSTIVACGSRVWVLDVATQTVLWDYNGEFNVFDTCTLSAKGNKIFAADRQGGVFAWQRASAIPSKTWTVGEDFINHIVVSNNGRRLFGEDDTSYFYIATKQDGLKWRQTLADTSNEILDLDLNANGKKAFLIQRDITGDNQAYLVTGIDIKTGAERWNKAITSHNTPYGEMSDQGANIVVSTNDAYYGLANKTGAVTWQFNLIDGDNTTVAQSGNGKFATVTQGSKYIYLFDSTFTGSSTRPFHILQDVFPDAVAMSNDGSSLAYSANDLFFKQIPPGVLTDQPSLPIYSTGNDIALSQHISNPGKATTVKMTVSVSLPQIDMLESLGLTVADASDGEKSKLLEYTQESLPGYEEVYNEYIDLPAHGSSAIDTSFEMPSLLLPSWVNNVVSGLDLDEIFNTMLGEYDSPVVDMVNGDFKEALWDSAASMQDQYTYPLIGIGRVEIRDVNTDELYSNDTFVFMYVL